MLISQYFEIQKQVENALLAEDVQLETFGGDVPCVYVSGLTGRGLEQLVETISAVAEMQDLRAERDGVLHGYVLESKIQKGLGYLLSFSILYVSPILIVLSL